MKTLIEQLKEEKVIAILRGVPFDQAIRVVNALVDGGIRFIEFTLNSERALELIALCKEKYKERIRLGAGTVLNIRMAEEALKAGAEYLISPNVDEGVIEYGVSQQIDVWSGAMTPTEIVKAYHLGASAVKLFPYSSLGAKYLKEIKAPLDNIPIIATGGVGIDNAYSAFNAGAIAIGVGSQLLDKQLIKENKYDDLKRLSQEFLKIAKHN
jgi:2-dehydro-3-deoxyphosphogluconate aldolase / (4S)-4-hydroxy-2-oxoglutarate aldolase